MRCCGGRVWPSPVESADWQSTKEAGMLLNCRDLRKCASPGAYERRVRLLSIEHEAG